MENFTKAELEKNKKYLELLSGSFPNITTAVGEVVNLTAILNLPKSTEHFLTDIHGEHEAFNHVMQNASGAIRRKEMCIRDRVCDTDRLCLPDLDDPLVIDVDHAHEQQAQGGRIQHIHVGRGPA